jgi:hypothetical protein
LTLVAALRIDGLMAPYVVDGAMDGPASPADITPLERAFSMLQAAPRNVAARTVDALLKLIGKVVKSFAPEECANYFAHAGYVV